MTKIVAIKNRLVDYPLLTGKTFTLFVLFFTIVMECLIAELGFPATIRYFNDVLILILMLGMLLRPGHVVKSVGIPIALSTAVLFLIFTLSAVVNDVRMPLYLWAVRNTFRGIAFFYACVIYLRKEDLTGIFDAFLLLQGVSVVLVLYQHFMLGLNMDETGGIFGHGNGAGVNPFNALLFSFFFNQYLAGKTSLGKLGFALISSLVIAAIAEEKITFVYFIIIACVSILLSKTSFRLTVAVFVAVAAGWIGLTILKSMYPAMFDVMSSIDKMEDYLMTSYESGYMLPRIGSFPIIQSLFFKHDAIHNLLGVGFGNGETSTFSFLVGPYYALYGYLNYRWFTHQWVFLECGYLGFACYLGFFLVIGLCLLNLRRKVNRDLLPYLTCGFALVICTVISIWYNATLKVDMCYLFFFSLAIGFIASSAGEEKVPR